MKIIWTRIARGDFTLAISYIEEKNPVAAERLAHMVHSAVMGIAEFPQRGRPGKLTDTRDIIFLEMPYFLSYRIMGDVIVVVAFLHQKRKWP